MTTHKTHKKPDERYDERYDYGKQAWIVDGRYVRCGHPHTTPPCGCYGRIHEDGEQPGLANA